jgi:hypothetical protein
MHKTTKKAYQKKKKQSCLWIVQETKPHENKKKCHLNPNKIKNKKFLLINEVLVQQEK